MAESHYFSDFTITVRFVENPLPDAEADEIWTLQSTQEGVIDDIHAPALALQEELQALGNERPAYALDTQYRYLSWGAAGAAEEIGLDIAKTLATAGVKAAVLAGLRRAGNFLRRPTAYPAEPPTREQLEFTARWTIVQRFGLTVEPQALDLLSDEEKVAEGINEWTFTHDGWRYEIEVIEDGPDALYRITRVRRERISE